MTERHSNNEFLPHDRYNFLQAVKTLSSGKTVSWIGETTRGEKVVMHRYPGETERRATIFADTRLEGWTTIYEVIPGHNQILIARQWVEGESLSDIITLRDALPGEREARDFFATVCKGLNNAAEVGLAHGNLKPSNLFLVDNAHALITDPLLSDEIRQDPERTLGEFIHNTLMYCSPELLRQQPLTPASDIYSLACIMYEWLTGSPPFMESTVIRMYDAHLWGEPPAIRQRRGDLSEEIETILLTALKKDPAQRFGSYTEFADQLGGSDNYSLYSSEADKRTPPTTTTRESPEKVVPREDAAGNKESETWDTMALSQKAIQEALERAQTGEEEKKEKTPETDTREVPQKEQKDSKIPIIESERPATGILQQEGEKELPVQGRRTSTPLLVVIILMESLLIIFLIALLLLRTSPTT